MLRSRKCSARRGTASRRASAAGRDRGAVGFPGLVPILLGWFLWLSVFFGRTQGVCVLAEIPQCFCCPLSSQEQFGNFREEVASKVSKDGATLGSCKAWEQNLNCTASLLTPVLSAFNCRCLCIEA